MKGTTRIIFSVYLLVVIAACLYVLATLVGLLPTENLNRIATSVTGENAWIRILTFIILLVFVAVGFSLLFFGIKKEKQKAALIASYDSGTISIAVNALEDLAKRFVKQTGSVKGEAIKVLTLGEEVEVDLKIKILPEVNMPQITQELQSGLIQYIETYSGIKVARAKVMIASIDESIKDNKITGGR
jgi:uncharacterized alkaline shock family protein YloU